MATVTVTLTEVCAGGEHLTFSVSGAKTLEVHSSLEEVLSPLTDEEASAFCKALSKLVKVGRNLNQTRTVLQNGVTITV